MVARHTQQLDDLRRRQQHRTVELFGHDPPRQFAANRGDLPLQIPHAGLFGVAFDDLLDGVATEAHLHFGCETVLLQLLGHQVAFADRDLLVQRVAR